MIYLENIYICMVAPFIIAGVCAPKAQRTTPIFIICGMSACLVSAYINLFITQLYQVDVVTASLEIAPLVEEIMKLLPIIFYLIIFEPKHKQIAFAVLMTAVGFALLENICYLVEYGADNLRFMIMRGFGTGAMHIVCGAVMAYGLLFTWSRTWLRAVGTLGVLCIAVTYHAEYNLLMSAGSWERLIGLLMPMSTILLAIVLLKIYRRKNA